MRHMNQEEYLALVERKTTMAAKAINRLYSFLAEHRLTNEKINDNVTEFLSDHISDHQAVTQDRLRHKFKGEFSLTKPKEKK